MTDGTREVLTASPDLATPGLKDVPIVTPRDYREALTDYRNSGTATRGWNVIYLASKDYNFFEDFTSKVTLKEEVRIPTHNWLSHYSFLAGMYVDTMQLSALALERIVLSEDLYKVPGVGPKIFDLSASVVKRKLARA